MKFSAIVRDKGKETGRSEGMTIESALSLIRKINRALRPNLNYSHVDGNSSYIEETQTVKHLPVTISR